MTHDKNDDTNLSKKHHLLPRQGNGQQDDNKLRRVIGREDPRRDDRLADDVSCINFADLAQLYPNFAREWRVVATERNKQRKQRKRQREKQTSHQYDSSTIGTNNDVHATRSTNLASHATPSFQLELSRAILHKYFDGLVLPSLPPDRLCPPIPNRSFYVRWILNELLPLLNDPRFFEQPQRVFDFAKYESTTPQMQQSKATVKTSPSGRTEEKSMILRGLDIGTGASCIYPLLASRCAASLPGSPKLFMIATEIDPVSIESAIANVQANQLQDRIHILPVNGPSAVVGGNSTEAQSLETLPKKISRASSPHGPVPKVESTTNFHPPDTITKTLTTNPCLLSSDSFAGGPVQSAFDALKRKSIPEFNEHNSNTKNIDFCMTNPPFFEGTTTTLLPARADGRDRTPMADMEACTEGGEVQFVLGMILDSIRLYNCRQSGPIVSGWYSCMLGQKTSFTRLYRILVTLVGRGRVVYTHLDVNHQPGNRSVHRNSSMSRKENQKKNTMVRWFLAWTLHRSPTLTSPLCRIDTDNNIAESLSSVPIRQGGEEPRPHSADANKDDHDVGIQSQPRSWFAVSVEALEATQFPDEKEQKQGLQGGTYEDHDFLIEMVRHRIELSLRESLLVVVKDSASEKKANNPPLISKLSEDVHSGGKRLVRKRSIFQLQVPRILQTKHAAKRSITHSRSGNQTDDLVSRLLFSSDFALPDILLECMVRLEVAVVVENAGKQSAGLNLSRDCGKVGSTLVVHVTWKEAFSYTVEGTKFLDRYIRQAIPQAVSRTSRKWRRRLAASSQSATT